MRLSQLDPGEVKVESQPAGKAPLKLSELGSTPWNVELPAKPSPEDDDSPPKTMADRASELPEEKDGPRAGQAYMQGLGNAGLLGYLPEAQAAAGGLVPKSPGFDEEEFSKPDKFGNSGKVVQPEDTYDSRVDENRSRQAQLKQESPEAYNLGQVSGLVGTMPLYSAGLAKLGVQGGVQAKTALEGAKQGLIQGVKAGGVLGFAANPNENPGERGFNLEARAKNAAGSAVIGGGLGAVGGGLVSKYGTPQVEPVSEPTSPELNNSVSVDEAPKATRVPKSVEDLKSQVAGMKESGVLKDAPSADRLNKIAADNPDLPKPIPGFHDEMLKNKSSYQNLRAIAESPTDAGNNIRAYEQGMKQAAEQKLGDFVSNIGNRPPLPKMDAGDELMHAVSDNYTKNKQVLGPVFDSFKELQLPKQKIVPEIQNKLAQDIPKLKSYLNFDNETGDLVLKPFTPKMGITEQAHAALSKTVDALNSKTLSFEDMQNIREYLRQSIDPANPKATQVLSDARKSMLNYMQDLVQSKQPKANVRGTFQQYAINEKNLEQFESIIGGKLEHADQLLTANPERVLDRVFSNTNNIKVTRQIIGEDAFKNLTADYLHNLVQKATDKGSLSSNKLMTMFRQKEPALVEAIGDKKLEQRLRDLVDYMRLVPDTAPVNPSGTASTLLRMQNIMHPSHLLKEGLGAIQQAMANSQTVSKLNNMMSPAPPPITKVGSVPSGMNNIAGSLSNINSSPARMGGSGLLKEVAGSEGRQDRKIAKGSKK